MIAIHVDDIKYAGTKSLDKVVVEALGDSLPTENLGEFKFFLGCEFIHEREAVDFSREIHQECSREIQHLSHQLDPCFRCQR